MADAPDRSPEAPAGFPAVDVTVPIAGPVPARAAPMSLPQPEQTEPYRPLSLLAVAGFVLGGAYALLVGLGGVAIFATRYPRFLLVLTILTPLVAVLVAVGRRIRGTERLAAWAGCALAGLFTLVGLAGLVAFSGTNPWVLPTWTILVPIGTAALCWMARSRIQAAEDTLAGASLANWGLILSVFFGLNYAAYLASNHVAISQQAGEFTSNWLDLIRQDKLLEAFTLTLPAANRPRPVRGDIERRFNASRDPREQGPFSMFSRATLVHQILMGGPETRFQLLSSSPAYESSLYRVTLQYRVFTRYAQFDLVLVAVGNESVNAGETGRNWQILGDTIQLSNNQWSDLGREMASNAQLAEEQARQFGMAMERRDLESAYAATGGSPKGTPGFQKDWEAFQNGGLVQFRPEEFWVSDPKLRDEMIKAVQFAFHPGNPNPPQWKGATLLAPKGLQVGDRFQFRIPVLLTFGQLEGGPRFTVDGELLVEAKHKEGEGTAGAWAVRGLALVRGQPPSKPVSRPGS